MNTISGRWTLLVAIYPFRIFSQIEEKMTIYGVVSPVKKKHLHNHGAGENLSRYEKIPQIHRSGEFR
jgi:hypothetical protein